MARPFSPQFLALLAIPAGLLTACEKQPSSSSLETGQACSANADAAQQGYGPLCMDELLAANAGKANGFKCYNSACKTADDGTCETDYTLTAVAKSVVKESCFYTNPTEL